MGRGWYYKTLWETAPSEVTYFSKKKVIFHEFDFETSDSEFEVSKWSIWKHTTMCDNSVFSSIIISQLRPPIELKFPHVFIFFLICWDTASEKTSLWQLSKVSRIFKGQIQKNKKNTKHQQKYTSTTLYTYYISRWTVISWKKMKRKTKTLLWLY